MMSWCESLGKMRISMSAASQMRDSTPNPRTTSPHQSSPSTSIFLGPLSREASSLKARASSSERTLLS